MTGYERARAEINLANIRDNLINLKKLAAPEAKALASVIVSDLIDSCWYSFSLELSEKPLVI